MMANTLEEKVMESLHQLPAAYQAEALDFIEFLKTRHQTQTELVENDPTAARARVRQKYQEIRTRGGPQIEAMIEQLGGPWPSLSGWNSTDFIRQDRDRH